jgi:DNA-binding MarR family transcriptional regulator
VEALDLILLGRHLMKIGEEGMRGSIGGSRPTGQSLVLRDVFTSPASTITEITARTGLPQSYVSESVARLRDAGILETSADPADGRRTLVRVSDEHPRNVIRKGSVSVDGALADTFGDESAARALEALAGQLRRGEAGPIVQQLDNARGRRAENE